jgi:hypothetical protein
MMSSSIHDQTQSKIKRTFREMSWLRAGLGLGSAFITQEFSSIWGQHLAPTDLHPLSIAVGMTFYNLHLFNLIPANDDRSKLRAIWLPDQKRIAIFVTLGLLIASLFFLSTRLSRPIKEMTIDHITSLRPINRGLFTATGTPQIEESPYRWVFADLDEADKAPYLTPLKEFKGQLLVVTKGELTHSLDNAVGWISELSILARPHYVAYRNYMGLTPNAPIYLFDIRGVWWFDPHAFAAVITAILLLIATIGSATRDPNNHSRLLYIPPELRDETYDRNETKEQASLLNKETDTEAETEAETGAEAEAETEAEEEAEAEEAEIEAEIEAETEAETETEAEAETETGAEAEKNA